MNSRRNLVWIPIAVLFLLSLYAIYYSFSLQNELSTLEEEIVSISQRIPRGSLEIARAEEDRSIERNMSIVAVSSDGRGSMGSVKLRVMPGSNSVLINTDPFLEPDLQYSVNKAVAVAKLNSDHEQDMDFIFSYSSGEADLIGGESAGAATAILTIASIENKTLKDDVIITGTVNPDGSIGFVGGLMEKAASVADAGFKRFLVPEGQGTIIYYERQAAEAPSNSRLRVFGTRYVTKTIDLKKYAMEQWGLEIIEVANIEEALPYFIV